MHGRCYNQYGCKYRKKSSINHEILTKIKGFVIIMLQTLNKTSLTLQKRH